MDQQKKRELRDLNSRVWAGDRDVFPVNKSLDSSLKKNTAFIKRLRTGVSPSAVNTLLQEIRTLSLHKYLSEITSGCYEGLCKLKTPAEIAAGVELVSAMHQRFGPADFTGHLGWYIGRGLSTPDKNHLKSLAAEVREKEDKERTTRQRALLKVVTELWLTSVLRGLEDAVRPDDAGAAPKDPSIAGGKDLVTKSKAQNSSKSDTRPEAEPFPLEVLKELLGYDREHVNLPTAVLFVKSFGFDVLGVKHMGDVKGQRDSAGEELSLAKTENEEFKLEDETPTNGIEEEQPQQQPLTSAELQQRFRNIFVRYFEDVKAHIIRDQRALANQARRNAEVYVKSGEIFEDRQSNYEKQVKAHDKLVYNARIIAETLELEMPKTGDDDEGSATRNADISLVKKDEYLRGQNDGPGIWDDDEERRFYENLIDLKERVPGILLEDPKKKKNDAQEPGSKKVEENGEQLATETSGQKADPENETASAADGDADDKSVAIANKTIGAQVDALLARLPEMTNKELVDQAAIDFCFLNSKASRNRLNKALQEVPKGRLDLLPLYARLTTTLGRYMTDIAQSLLAYLDGEFRSLQRRKEKDFLGQVRTMNVRYLAELTKFGLVPEHVVFHCFKVSLDEFSRMNIDIICNLLEHCGRYLLRNPNTQPRMSSFLETLQRKKSAQHVGQQERMLIENAVYYVNPPERAAIEQRERTPVELFIRKLIYLDLNKRNYPKILKQIRKLHWEDAEVVDILTKIFSKPGKVKHSSIHLLAVVLGILHRYHPDFVIGVIDDVLERVTVGLENNDFRYNQKRLAEVKYLGELYNFKTLDSPVIFDCLYRIITFGHEGGTPKAGRLCPLDMPDDFFRVRLACTLLDTCGTCFDRGAAKKKLDFFLNFLQYYIFTKDPLPMDIDFLLHDTYTLLRPEWKLASNLAEASQSFAEAIAANYGQSNEGKAGEPESSSSEEETGRMDEEDIRLAADEDEDGKGEEDQSSSNEEEAIGEDEDSPLGTESDEEEEHIVVTRQQKERDPEAEAEFDRELAKMMTESLDSRKFERKPMFDVPLPMRSNKRETVPAAEGDTNHTDELSARAPQTKMAFSLLTKRGNRQHTRQLELPSDSHFAVAMRTQQQAEREEQQRIKNLVLNYDLRDDNDEGDMSRRAFQPNKNPEKPATFERQQTVNTRPERPAGGRHQVRGRRLQMSDVDW